MKKGKGENLGLNTKLFDFILQTPPTLNYFWLIFPPPKGSIVRDSYLSILHLLLIKGCKGGRWRK